jgi:hypothetical protein
MEFTSHTERASADKRRRAELAARLLLRLADHGLVLKVHPGIRRYIVGRSVTGTWPIAVQHHAATLGDISAWLDDRESEE